MKKLLPLLAFLTALTLQVSATKHIVTTSGLAYSPAVLAAHIGDTVTISGSISHPLLQVSKTTWDKNGMTALPGGFGPTTKTYTFTVSSADTVYYICTAHVSFGMKGKVVVAQFSGINDLTAFQPVVSVYPNPMTSVGTVRLTSFESAPASVFVYNISGQLEKDLSKSLISQDGDYYISIDSGTMPAGNHFVMVSDGKNKLVKRFEVIR